MLSSIADPPLSAGHARPPYPCLGRNLKIEKKTSSTRSETQYKKLANVITLTQHQINKRIKQIEFGKNTVGYINYASAIPKNQRIRK